MDWEKEISREDLKAFFVRIKRSVWFKVFLAGASFVAFAIITTWQLSLFLIGGIAIHEYGHMWAMKRYGLTKVRFHFIPFLGGVTIGEGLYPSHKSKALTALAGPVFGLAPVPILLGISYLVSSPFWAGMASIIAFVSFANLFPLLPFDGGRIAEAIAATGRKKIEPRIRAAFFVSGYGLAIVMDLETLAFIGIFGALFLRESPEVLAKIPKMTSKEAVFVSFLHAGILLASLALWMLASSFDGSIEIASRYYR